jgi:gliding motility associated protien GldN
MNNMKKLLIMMVALAAFSTAINAQSVIGPDNGSNPNDFYQKGIVVGKKAMPHPFIRESDVVWTTTIFRTIDLNEKFNQFFYFPAEDKERADNRVSLINLIIRAVNEGTFEVYENDEMLEPIANPMVWLAGEPYEKEKDSTDANGNPVYDEYGDIYTVKYMKAREFDPSSVTKLILKECWYIDKQDSRQKVRIVGLSFWYEKEMAVGDPQVAKGFWIPMNDMRVRQVLVNANAFDENNDVVERSYDDIFIQRYFDSYITQESNTYNRSIDQYLTGEDAILESQRIEDKIFDMESGMWEY